MAVVAKISCGGVAVNLTIYPVDFQFLQFEQWLRGKFTLCEGAKLTFRDRMGNGEREGVTAIYHSIKLLIFLIC